MFEVQSGDCWKLLEPGWPAVEVSEGRDKVILISSCTWIICPLSSTWV